MIRCRHLALSSYSAVSAFMFLSLGCWTPTGPHVGRLRQPVVVGPVERIGDGDSIHPSRAGAQERVSCTFEAGASRESEASSSFASDRVSDTAARTISNHLGVPGRRVRVADIRATARGHFTLFFVLRQSIQMDTEILDDGLVTEPNQWDPCRAPE